MRKSRIITSVALGVAGLVALAGCSASLWPQPNADEVITEVTPSSEIEQALINEDAPPPGLARENFQEILTEARDLAATADSSLDAAPLEARFAGAALRERQINIQLRTADGEIAALDPIPNGDLQIFAPQSTTTWPRSVLGVIVPAEGSPSTVPVAIVATQDNPRVDFRISSEIPLSNPDAMPEMISAEIGAASVATDAQGFVVAPQDLANNYVQLVDQGSGAPVASLFDTASDSFLTLTTLRRTEQMAAISEAGVSELSYQARTTADPVVTFETSDGGAIVALTIEQVETLRATNERAEITNRPEGEILSGVDSNSTGFTSTTADQLLFYVPSTSVQGLILTLGFSESIISSAEIEE